jgi:hypothetical protein
MRVKRKLFPLPWWFVIIGYASAYGVVAICLYFIVVFGFALGETLVTQWVIALVIGTVKEVMVIEPVKV